MSIEALNWVQSARLLKGPLRAVLWALANRAKPHPEKGTNTAHVCWPSIKTIADESGLSTATVERALKKLQQDGCIKIHSRRVPTASGACNLYDVPIKVRETMNDAVSIRESKVPITHSKVSIGESEVSISVRDKPKEPKVNRKEPSAGFQKNGGVGAIPLLVLYQWIDGQKKTSSWSGPAKVLAQEFMDEMKKADWCIQGQPVADGLAVFKARLTKKGMLPRKSLKSLFSQIEK